MGRFLAFERATSKIKEINTTTGIVADVGPVIAGLELSSLWDLRNRNLVAVFRGDYYLIGRTAINEIVIYQWDGAAMSLVHGPIAPVGAGAMHPLAIHVVNDVLAAYYVEVGGGADEINAVLTSDGAVWSPVPFPSGVAPSRTAASITWRRTNFLALETGIFTHLPIAGTWEPVPDTGDDTFLLSAVTAAGSFAPWNNDLHFLRPDSGTGPALYRLSSTWSIAAPIAPPAWTNQAATGFPSVGVLTAAPDGGNYCLFRNVVDELCAIISGASGTFLIKTDASSYPAFTDVTATLLPASIAALVDAGSALYEDDRRRTNQLQYFVIRDPVMMDTYILSWDGVNAMQIVATYNSFEIMPPNDPKADYRTYTAQEPTIEFDPSSPPSEPFPGRVLLPYIVKDVFSRLVDISPEYSEDGDEWFPMTEGNTELSDGTTNLITSPSGESHTFAWDAFVDLNGDKSDLKMRIVARISGV